MTMRGIRPPFPAPACLLPAACICAPGAPAPAALPPVSPCVPPRPCPLVRASRSRPLPMLSNGGGSWGETARPAPPRSAADSCGRFGCTHMCRRSSCRRHGMAATRRRCIRAPARAVMSHCIRRTGSPAPCRCSCVRAAAPRPAAWPGCCSSAAPFQHRTQCSPSGRSCTARS